MPDHRTGVDLIADERRRQVETEGWAPDHDDTHTHGELAAAACAYAMAADPDRAGECAIDFWPFERDGFKPGDDPTDDDAIRNLAKAGALIAAEIDRRIRADNMRPLETEVWSTPESVEDEASMLIAYYAGHPPSVVAKHWSDYGFTYWKRALAAEVAAGAEPRSVSLAARVLGAHHWDSYQQQMLGVPDSGPAPTGSEMEAMDENRNAARSEFAALPESVRRPWQPKAAG